MTQTSPKHKSKNQSIRKKNIDPHNNINPRKNISRNKTPLMGIIDRFSNLSIRQKQIIVLLAGQIISIGCILSVGIVQNIQSGREQLIDQSESELSVAQINYEIKINQMGFGFRGQSDNTAIVEASLNAQRGRTLSPRLKPQIEKILQNEINARNIEYATLVGIDRRIIANANNDRTREIFDPNGLVTQLINDPKHQQIKTSEIVSWTELKEESPPIFPKLTKGEDALIRYVITPVFNPNNNNLIGVLIAGDVVDGKYTIVENTVNKLNSGYAAIYKVIDKENQNIQRVNSLKKDNQQKDLELKKDQFLRQLLEKPDTTTSIREKLDDNFYTLTALTLKNAENEPVAFLIRGTSESGLSQIIFNSITVQSGVAVIIIGLNLLLILLLSKSIAERIEKLQNITQDFSEGNQALRSNIKGNDEIGKLALTFNQLADNIVKKEDDLVQEARQVIFLQEITGAKTEKDKDVDQIFNKIMKKARRLMKVDRIVIYRFNPDWSGYISHEAVSSLYPSALTEEITDPCIPANLREAYVKGRIVPTENVFEAGFSPEHLALMERLIIKANLVAPIINQGQLFGLLIAHDCENPHKWKDQEINFINQMANRFGIILDRVDLIKTQVNVTTRAEQLKEITLFIASCINRQQLLELSVAEILPVINTSRILIYEFDENWKGTITAESVYDKYPKSLGANIADPCFAQKYVNQYEEGRVKVTPDIYKENLTPCHLKQLEPFEVKASMVAPILVKRKLIGLLVAHQCDGPRKWEQGEIDLFSQIATQVGLGLERVKLLENQRKSEEEQRGAREKLQQRALELLVQVDPVSQGDLTIRATVTEDEIGTIADSYNATIESLRKIVTQVQSVSTEITETTNNNEMDVTQLKEEIREQVENIALALDRISIMSKSSITVSESAEKAEEALQRAQESVEKGDIAMNRTVDSILGIRATVQDTAIQVKRLGETTKQISKVVNLISRFAAQTHMLALKASIEAARAGEEGKGFAVIANEVRNLASQSAEATADIEKLVNSIQSETKTVVLAMEASSEQVVEGSKLVEETQQNLNQITAATIQINELVEVIAAAAFEQSENSEEVKDKMSDVAKVAERTTNSVSQLSDSFRQLLEVSQELEANVSKFKV